MIPGLGRDGEVVIKFTQMLFEFLVNDQKNDGPRLLWKSCGLFAVLKSPTKHRVESLEAKVDSGKCEDKHMNDLPSGYD